MCGRKRWFRVGLLLVLVVFLTGWVEQVQSQEKYPTRAIEIIVPGAAGGSTDLGCRLTAAYLNKKWGVPVNAVNKPGGNSIPATVEVYSAAPNGYTMLGDAQHVSSLLAVAVKDLPFKMMDRTYIATYSASPMILFLPPNSPFKTLEDFIAEAKKNPGNISYTSIGGTGGLEFAIRQLFKAIGVDISKTRAILTRGGAETVVLAAGGHVTLGSSTVASALPAIKGGNIRPLFVTSKNRYPDLPDVPTSAELGYPTVNIVHWNAISGPPKLPSHIADMWGKAMGEMVKDPGFVYQLKNVGLIPFYLDGQALKEFVIKEIEEMNILR